MMGTCSECFHWDACRCVVRAHGKSPMAFEYYLGACCPRFADKTKYVEQKHGRWEIVVDDYDCEMMKCSCCGAEFYDGDNDTVDSLHNYCPNCGAKMDGD